MGGASSATGEGGRGSGSADVAPGVGALSEGVGGALSEMEDEASDAGGSSASGAPRAGPASDCR